MIINTRLIDRTAWMLVFVAIMTTVVSARIASDPTTETKQANPNALPIAVDRGAAGLARILTSLRTRASILMITAHPDDEDGGLLAFETRGIGARGALLTLNRGEGGQDAMSTDLYDALGVMRTQELLAADRYYGVDQYWTNVIDYGFSKTREEALDKWNHERVLAEVVRVVRMTRPLVLTSVFVGAPTDGHGNHQVAGQMAQEAFVAAGDPKRFPEQIQEGLRPWTPLKVYERVPVFSATKEGIYDYATDKYVPVRFFNYVDQTWINGKPSADVSIAEGSPDSAAGLTFLQIGREGLGQQKSQNGGITIPPPARVVIQYHRYGSRVPVSGKEESFYDGIDTSLVGIANLAKGGDTTAIKKSLAQLSDLAGQAADRYRPNTPVTIAPILGDGLKATRALIQEVKNSNLPEPGKSDILFELRAKQDQFEKALTLALGLTFEAAVAPAKPPSGPFAMFAGPSPTFAIAIPGQSFPVNTHLYNQSLDTVDVEGIDLLHSDKKEWKIQAGSPTKASLPGGMDVRSRFEVGVPPDAVLTKPYFYRPNKEQPYYDLTDERYRNLSLAPYPLSARARIRYHDVPFEIRQVVQAVQRVPTVGIKEDPLLLGPPISVMLPSLAGAVPLTTKSFPFSCTLHSNVKGSAKGTLHLELPSSWEAIPKEVPFSMTRDGEDQEITFQIRPNGVRAQPYEVKAVAEYNGKPYQEGYRLIGYPGLRSYPYYRAAVYKAVGVDVNTPAGLRVAFLPGTGDDVPRALADLGVDVHILSLDDVNAETLNGYDAVVLGVRAYTAHPELRGSNDQLLRYVKDGGTLVAQYNLDDFEYGPYPLSLGSNPAKVVDENSKVDVLQPNNPVLNWPNKITEADFRGWEEERGHGFMKTWDPRYQAPIETHDPGQDPQCGGLLVARYGKGTYVYDAFALYRQLAAGVPGAYRILANLVSIRKNETERKTPEKGNRALPGGIH
ncbi:MAG TPA: PIG-L family deacetylase [Bryobacteraceae bacterium]